MKRSLKAVLLSIFICPGVGHFYLKKTISGSIFITLFAIPLSMLFIDILNKMNQLITEINTGRIPLDINAINNEVLQISADLHSSSPLIYAMMIIWFISAIDAYRLGKIQL